MRYKTLCMPLMLAACSHTELVTEPVIAKVPVAVSCNAKPVSEPGWNVPHLAENATSTAELQAILVDLDLSKGYIEELQAELKACS